MKATVLIVDDEPLNVDLLVSLLAPLYEIRVGYDGREALEILKKIEPDFILLDIMMPRLDGYGVIEEIQKDERLKEIPVVFLTAKSDHESIIKGFELGAVDYVTKPFNKQELLVRVANHINRYRLQKTLEEQNEFIQAIVDAQPNMILLTDGHEMKFVNRALLEFYGCASLDQFLATYGSLSKTFIHNEHFFYPASNETFFEWIERFMKLSQDERVVSVYSKQESSVRALSVSVSLFRSREYILNMSDITQTVAKKAAA